MIRKLSYFSWNGKLNKFTALVLLSILKISGAELLKPCRPHHQSLVVSVHIHLLFAGSAPIFMRESSWTSDVQHSFLSHMNSVVRHPAMDFKRTPIIGSVLPNMSHTPCSVMEYIYSYELTVVPSDTVAILDQSLSSILASAESSIVDGAQVADKFHEILSRKDFIKSTEVNQQHHQRRYYFMIYNNILVSPQYGYRSDAAGPILATALSLSERFAFLDVGARPGLFAEKSGITTGEILMSLSRSKDKYAETLHTIISNIITPSMSTNMRHFPLESQIQFTLQVADVGDVISEHGFEQTGGESNPANIFPIDTNRFLKLLQSAFGHLSNQKKSLFLSTDLIELEFNAKVAMAISRAFTHHNMHLILDSGQLYVDLIVQQSKHAGYYVDSSFVAHIPLYLFSFNDGSRSVHLSQAENLRGVIIERRAVFLVENRARSLLSGHPSTTYEAASLVLQLLFGLCKSSLAHLNVSNGAIPLILGDQIRRNALVLLLDWSERTAGSKAEQLLNFEGIDSRFIPHEQGSSVQDCRLDVEEKLNHLRAVWRQAASVFQGNGVEVATTQLTAASERLASKLHDEICNQRLSQEILLKAGADVGTKSVKEDNPVSFGRFVFIPALSGALITYLFITITSKMGNRGTLGSNYREFYSSNFQRQPTQWFSTLLPLREMDKSKTC